MFTPMVSSQSSMALACCSGNRSLARAASTFNGQDIFEKCPIIDHDAGAFVECFLRLEDALSHGSGISQCASLSGFRIHDEGLDGFANDEAVLFEEILDRTCQPACFTNNLGYSSGYIFHIQKHKSAW